MSMMRSRLMDSGDVTRYEILEWWILKRVEQLNDKDVT